MKRTPRRRDGAAKEEVPLPLRWEEIALPSGSIGLFRPSDPDALLDRLTDDEFRRSDERMPYFALVWPSALVLAERVLAGPSLAGRRALDLGSGVGLAGLAALARGADTTFLDWEPRALEIARRSVEAAGREAVYVACDWREPPALPRYDLVLGADLLYEERNAGPVAAFLAAHLTDGGEAWIADPGRRHGTAFPDRASEAGLSLLDSSDVVLTDGSRAVVHRLARARERGP